MAKSAEAPKTTGEPVVKKYRFILDKKAHYRCDVRDAKRNVVETYFCLDLTRTWSEEMRERFERAIELSGAKVYKSGEVFELPPPADEPYMNAAAIMLRAKAIEEVKE